MAKGHHPSVQLGGEGNAKILNPQEAERTRRIARDSFAISTPRHPVTENPPPGHSR